MTKNSLDILQDILVHTGETKQAIAGLREDIHEVKQHIQILSEQAVKLPACDLRHQAVDHDCTALGAGLLELRQNFIQLTAPKGAKHWLGVIVSIIAILSFVGTLGWGLVKMGGQIAAINKATSAPASAPGSYKHFRPRQ